MPLVRLYTSDDRSDKAAQWNAFRAEVRVFVRAVGAWACVCVCECVSACVRACVRAPHVCVFVCAACVCVPMRRVPSHPPPDPALRA
jgi:hypothetical protein